jgi:hypothetical protein
MVKRFFFPIFFLVVLIVSYFWFSNFKKNPVTVTGTEISTETLDFVKSVSSPGNLSFSEITCDKSGVCSIASQGPNQSASLYWRLLPLSQENPLSPEYENLVQKIVNLPEPNYTVSLWQVYEAIKSTNDERLAEHWVKGISRLFFSLKYYQTKSTLSSNYPMLNATTAYQLIDAIDVFNQISSYSNNPNITLPKHIQVISKFVKSYGYNPDNWSKELNIQLQNLLDILDKSHASGPRLFVNAGNTEYSFESCWTILAHSHNNKVLGNIKSKDEVSAFFRVANFTFNSRDSYNFPGAQMILPCLAAAKEQNLEDIRIALTNFLLENIDSEKRPICDGDGTQIGFYHPKNMPVCAGNLKSVGDSAWISFLIKNDSTNYTLEPVR